MKFLLYQTYDGLDCLELLVTVGLDDLKQTAGTAIWPDSLQMTGELDNLDCRHRLINIPVVDSAINWSWIDVSFE